MRHLVAIILFLLLSWPVFAQKDITGHVADSATARPLARASVTALRGGRPVAFVRTDGNGRFAMKVQQADSISVSFLGYAKKILPISSNTNYDVRLVPSSFSLREVKVSGTRAFGRQDTTFFDLKRFADKRDNSLKDVLKKLPGVDVDKNGKISFNGKDISRLTVENLDLTGGRYNKLTEALKAGDVDKAEVVEHDQPVKALQGKVFSDDVSMNIKLKPGARDRWMIGLKPAAKTDFALDATRPYGAVDALRIGRRRQTMYSAEYDCTGRDLSVDDMALGTGGVTSYGSGTSVPLWFAPQDVTYPIDGERMRTNRSFDIDVKNVSKNAAGGERRIAAGWLHTDEEQATGNTSVYYFDAENPQTTDENNISRVRHDRLYMDFSQTMNTEKAYGSEHFLMEGTRADGLSRIENTGNAPVTQRVKMPELHVSNLYRRIISKEKHTLSLLSDLDFHHSPMSMTVDGEGTKLGTTLLRADNNVKLTLVRRSLTHDYAAGAVVEHLGVRGGNTHFSFYAQPSWRYKRLSLDARLNVPMKWEIFSCLAKQYLDVSPSLSLNQKTGNRGELTLASGYQCRTGGWTSFALDGYDSDYRTHVTTHGVILRQGMFFANAGYDYKRPVMEFFSAFTVGYAYNHGNTMTDMTISDGKYLLDVVARDNHGQSVTVKTLASKGFFDLHLKTRLELRYTFSESSQLSAGKLTGYIYNICSASPEVSFSPSFATFTYSGMFTSNNMRAGGGSRNRLFCHTQHFSYTQSIGKIDISCSAAWYHNELQSARAVNTLLADAGIVWRMKKVRLQARVRNLFNRRDYTVTYYDGVMSSTSFRRLRPRELVADVQIFL